MFRYEPKPLFKSLFSKYYSALLSYMLRNVNKKVIGPQNSENV